MQSFLDHFDHVRRLGRPAALATVVGIDGGSSKRLGARLWVTTDGETFGSLTVGGCVDARARDEAAGVIESGAARHVRIDLSEDGLDFGMSCAGTVDVYIERVDLSSPTAQALDTVRSEIAEGRAAVFAMPLDDSAPSCALRSGAADAHAQALLAHSESACVYVAGDGTRPATLFQSCVPPRLLVIVGAAPIAQPLVRLGKMVGFRVVMVDGSIERLARERYPEADELLSGIPSEICRRLPVDERSAVVLTAHDYRYEVPVLKEVLQHATGYVGLVASRRRGGAVLDFLTSTGVDAAAVKRVHVPVGLDIGAMSPAEIAVSIMSEILAVRSGATGLPLVDLPEVAKTAEDDLMSPISLRS